MTSNPVPFVIAGMAGLSVLSDAAAAWFNRTGVAVKQWERFPRFRVALWGWHVDERNARRAFLLIRLPSYRWGIDPARLRECWCQATLHWASGYG